MYFEFYYSYLKVLVNRVEPLYYGHPWAMQNLISVASYNREVAAL